MHRIVPIILVIIICAGAALIGILLDSVRDRGVIMAFALLLVFWMGHWERSELEKRVQRLEQELSGRNNASSADPMVPLGDLKNPTPDQLARALGPKP